MGDILDISANNLKGWKRKTDIVFFLNKDLDGGLFFF